LIYALLPSSIFLTSITLREPYQLLFINMAIYAISNINILNNNKHWVILMLSVILLGALHSALIVIGALMLTLQIQISLFKIFSSRRFLSRAAFFVAASIIALFFLFFAFDSYFFDQGLIYTIQDHRDKAASIDGRANYYSVAEEGASRSIIELPILVFRYMVEPLPWRIGGLMDFVVFGENVLRGYLLLRILKIIKSVGLFRSILRIQLTVYLIAIEFLWAIGTVNWGTAIRHHVPSIGLLLIAALSFQQISGIKEELLIGQLGRNRSI
jgi:hypothetical protein